MWARRISDLLKIIVVHAVRLDPDDGGASYAFHSPRSAHEPEPSGASGLVESIFQSLITQQEVTKSVPSIPFGGVATSNILKPAGAYSLSKMIGCESTTRNRPPMYSRARFTTSFASSRITEPGSCVAAYRSDLASSAMLNAPVCSMETSPMSFLRFVGVARCRSSMVTPTVKNAGTSISPSTSDTRT